MRMRLPLSARLPWIWPSLLGAALAWGFPLARDGLLSGWESWQQWREGPPPVISPLARQIADLLLNKPMQWELYSDSYLGWNGGAPREIGKNSLLSVSYFHQDRVTPYVMVEGVITNEALTDPELFFIARCARHCAEQLQVPVEQAKQREIQERIRRLQKKIEVVSTRKE